MVGCIGILMIYDERVFKENLWSFSKVRVLYVLCIAAFYVEDSS